MNVLLVWPRMPRSFWGMEASMDIVGRKASQPPLGLVTIAALCPRSWTLRLIDRRAGMDLADEDLRWADVVMVSGMGVQRDDMREVLRRARAAGRRTVVGGPYASAEPEALAPFADHVVVGEPDTCFEEIAEALEAGTLPARFVVKDKPALTDSPVPRFDLLELGRYTTMPVQFSRGCPFQCEFCDIITIYGRRPRAKQPAQLLAELDELLRVGWRGDVYIVDDNFVGNHKLAAVLVPELERWQREHGFPISFFIEASLDLAQRSDLMHAMVRANFLAVFVGIESPSEDALREAKKFQNLRQDTLTAVRTIQAHGLWLTAGFIVGFDSDGENTFAQQVQFVEDAAIPWAMLGFLQAQPTTPLHARMAREGRLLPERDYADNFVPPNFRTRLPLPVLMRGARDALAHLYSADTFYRRVLRSLEAWDTSGFPAAPNVQMSDALPTLARSLWQQGVRSSYRAAYWRCLGTILRRWARDPYRLYLGLMTLVTGHHFITYAGEVLARLDSELATEDAAMAAAS